MNECDRDSVTVHLLIYNHRDYLERCIESVLGQTHKPLGFVISDNNSSDGSAEFVKERYPLLNLIENKTNLGYSRGHNLIIESCKTAYFMPLNPDTVLAEDYVEQLVRAIKRDDSAGMAAGKLYRNRDKIIDSTGVFFTPALRHLDRGSNEKDRGQFEAIEYIFGVSGAAPLFKREMIEDVKILGEFFDDDFFAYREDADLCWRAQLLGWKALYTPFAVAFHERKVLPSERRKVSEAINLHSVKNRFLMRIKNLTWGVGVKTFLFFSLRDALVVGYTLLFERTSLKAFVLICKCLPRTMKKRKLIMKKRVAKDRYLCRWFSWKPRTIKLGEGKIV
jgi:GT2 family glycosyltransferase